MTVNEHAWNDEDQRAQAENWGEELEDSRHEEMWRQDRNRLIVAASAGLIVSALIIVGSLIWVKTMRTDGWQDPSPPISSTAPAKSAAEQAADIEAKLHAMAPHEVLAISQGPQAESPKRVKAERIGTKVD